MDLCYSGLIARVWLSHIPSSALCRNIQDLESLEESSWLARRFIVVSKGYCTQITELTVDQSRYSWSGRALFHLGDSAVIGLGYYFIFYTEALLTYPLIKVWIFPFRKLGGLWGLGTCPGNFEGREWRSTAAVEEEGGRDEWESTILRGLDQHTGSEGSPKNPLGGGC